MNSDNRRGCTACSDGESARYSGWHKTRTGFELRTIDNGTVYGLCGHPARQEIVVGPLVIRSQIAITRSQGGRQNPVLSIENAYRFSGITHDERRRKRWIDRDVRKFSGGRTPAREISDFERFVEVDLEDQ